MYMISEKETEPKNSKDKDSFVIPKGMKGRVIAFDFETTGLSARKGDKAVSLAMVEMENGKRTGKELYLEFNPERDVPARSVAVHGLTEEYLRTKPTFKKQADEIIKFIGKDNPLLVAHNANFDMAFMNEEMNHANKKLPEFDVCDTMPMARKLYGTGKGQATLDNVLDKLGIDKSERDEKGHHALLDTQLLAEAFKPLMKAYWNKVDREAKSVSVVAKAMESKGR